MSIAWPQVGAIARRSVIRTARQPASVIPPLIFPIALMTVNAAGLQSSTELPGFPTDSFLAFALAVPFIQGALFSTMNAGTDLARDIQTGFVNRLALTALRDWALLVGQLAGSSCSASCRRSSTSPSASRRGSSSRPGLPGSRCSSSTPRRLARVRRARRVARVPHRLGRGDPGALPGPLRLPLHLLDERAARPDRRRVVPDRGDAEPGLVHDRVRPQPDHRRAGTRRRSCSASGSRSCSAIVSLALASRALRTRMTRT